GGGRECGSCHSIRDTGGSSGGTLAFDLTEIYSDYQDGAMTQFLRHPCTDRLPEAEQTAFLAPEEAFALKAYLRQCALTNQSGGSSRPVVGKTVDGTNSGNVTPGSAAAKPAAESPKRVAWSPKAAGTLARITRGS